MKKKKGSASTFPSNFSGSSVQRNNTEAYEGSFLKKRRPYKLLTRGQEISTSARAVKRTSKEDGDYGKGGKEPEMVLPQEEGGLSGPYHGRKALLQRAKLGRGKEVELIGSRRLEGISKGGKSPRGDLTALKNAQGGKKENDAGDEKHDRNSGGEEGVSIFGRGRKGGEGITGKKIEF